MAYHGVHSALAQRPYSSGNLFFFLHFSVWNNNSLLVDGTKKNEVRTYVRIYLFEQVWACFKSKEIMLRQPHKIPYLNAKSIPSFIVDTNTDTMAADTGADVIQLMASNVVK